ncbi:MAG: bifunctional UDP-N-acetylmuramoyl-tripeptide:D-alanyl-D-alanine ligase/alanine racemase [bacterium]
MSVLQYNASEIARITDGEVISSAPADPAISELLIDSRRLANPEGTLFIALVSGRNDGHRYIRELAEKGVKCFLISNLQLAVGSWQLAGNIVIASAAKQRDPVFILVSDTLTALQQLAAHHRKQFGYPVIGITGSNGKTIVKEWLYQLLSPDFQVIRSPKSFNSQLGVPLSVWKMEPRYDLAIFEAGISQPGEMDRLEEIIRPTIGILTNIGPAHDEHFSGYEGKAEEKLKIFVHSDILIYRSDYRMIGDLLERSEKYTALKRFTWGSGERDDLMIKEIRKEQGHSCIRGLYQQKEIEITIPFTDEASVENAIHCWALTMVLGIPDPVSRITDRFPLLTSVAMRLELKEAINHCSLINDSYNSDINSLGIALDFLVQQNQHRKKTLILSDILQTGRSQEELYGTIARILAEKKIDRIIGIGPDISRNLHQFPMQKAFFETTDEFLNHFPLSSFRDETILLKGARLFGFERISQALQQKSHETVLEINLDALVHNLNFYKAKLKPGVKIMAMVKAFSYGSGSYEIANLLQFNHVDYLAVAYADEGVELRNAGISLPIMVMSPEEESIETLLNYNLEPEIYNHRILRMLEEAIDRNPTGSREAVPIHIKLDTGMHRLGFCPDELDALIERITGSHTIRVCSVFSHLAGSEDPNLDPFTGEQFRKFIEMSEKIRQAVGYPVLRHILNSAGISRFPEGQFEMVRLGIGLYGVGYDEVEQKRLRNVSTLRSVITQIKTIQAGETIGYNRIGKAYKDSLIAIVPVGYADGLDRKLGNGRGHLLVKGVRAPVIGNICMDLCMLDITQIVQSGTPVNEGELVIIFGDDFPVTELAKTLETIPYEILTSISRRVKRIYFHE